MKQFLLRSKLYFWRMRGNRKLLRNDKWQIVKSILIMGFFVIPIWSWGWLILVFLMLIFVRCNFSLTTWVRNINIQINVTGILQTARSLLKILWIRSNLWNLAFFFFLICFRFLWVLLFSLWVKFLYRLNGFWYKAGYWFGRRLWVGKYSFYRKEWCLGS